jgi:signal transduction histidine kinase
MLRDRDGNLWIGTVGQGLLRVHQGRTDQFTQSDGLSSNSVLALSEDREGNIWVVTTNGLDRFRDFPFPAISVKQGLSSTVLGPVQADMGGGVWIGSPTGLNRWNGKQVTIYRKGSSGLPDDPAQCLFQDHRGRTWVATPRGVAYFENGRFIPVNSVPAGQIHAIAGDNAGNVWISHQDQGLFHLRDGHLVEQIPWARLGRKDFAYALLADPVQGGLWLGYFKSGVAYFKDGQVRTSYAGPDGLGEDRVNGLLLDRGDTLWAATEGGLTRVQNGRIATLTSKNGLPCDSVIGVLEDDDHSFWLYMACGVVRVVQPALDAWVTDPRRTVPVTVFDSSDGVRSHPLTNIFSPQLAKSVDGNLWLFSFDGVTVIDPRHLAFNPLPPPVHIEQIIADRKTYDASSKVRLPPLVRDLDIDYTALSLIAPEKIRFRYKLEGRDRDWQNVGNRRQAFYNDLPPRDYRFRVVASNNSGVWNEAGDSLAFSIAPAYYQTNWFRVLMAVVVLAMLWGLYRLRLYQIAREFDAQLNGRVEERLRIARELHDTLLQSFHGLMLRFHVVSKLLQEGKAKEQLEKALEHADDAIAEGRSAVYDLRSSTTATSELSEALNAVGNELATEDTAEFGFVVAGPPRDLHPIIRDELYRISREALRNAFKHAHARHIEAEINYEERVFRLRIRDDGDGIPVEILEQGVPGHYGLSGMRERAREVGADLTIWSRAGAGTEIDLSHASTIAYGTSPRRSRLRIFGKKVDET